MIWSDILRDETRWDEETHLDLKKASSQTLFEDPSLYKPAEHIAPERAFQTIVLDQTMSGVHSHIAIYLQRIVSVTKSEMINTKIDEDEHKTGIAITTPRFSPLTIV